MSPGQLLDVLTCTPDEDGVRPCCCCCHDARGKYYWEYFDKLNIPVQLSMEATGHVPEFLSETRVRVGTRSVRQVSAPQRAVSNVTPSAPPMA